MSKIKLNLLSKISWNIDDIKNYFSVGRDKAIKIRNEARKRGKSIPYKPFDVSIDSVLGLFNTNRENEIRLLTLTVAMNEEGELSNEK